MAKLSSIPPAGHDIESYRGDSFKCYIRIKRNGKEELLGPSTFRMQIRNSSEVIKELTSALSGGISIEVVGSGVLVLSIPADEMADLPIGQFTYDMQQTYPDGTVKTRFRGNFSIIDDVTKPV